MHQAQPKAVPLRAPSSSKKSTRGSTLVPINELTEQLDKTVGELEKSKRDNYERKFRLWMVSCILIVTCAKLSCIVIVTRSKSLVPSLL